MSLHPLHYTIKCRPHSEQPEKKCLDGISRFSPHTSVYLALGAFLVAVVVEGEPDLWVVDPHLHPDPVPVIKEVYDNDERGRITQVIILTATSSHYSPFDP